MASPIYTAENVTTAYQLNWSLSVFWRRPPANEDWLAELKAICEPDGVRILSHRFATSDCSLFFLSTRPEIRPSEVPRAIKGRLQHLVREQTPRAFQRNYDLHSIGSTQLDKAEAYVATQLQNHYPDDRSARRLLADLQLIDFDVDLSVPRFTAHARYRYNLHIVLVRDWRRSEHDPKRLTAVRSMIRRTSSKHGHLLSRMGLVPDHLHMILGCRPDERPIDVALSYLNNVVFVYDMQPVLMPSCFIGTIGEYDRGAIRPA